MPWDPKTREEKEAVERFRDEVGARLHEIDPERVENWSSMALGFFMGCGLPLEDARKAARWAGHVHHWWSDFA